MSGYIVDPMWFYWLQVSSSGRTFLMVVSIIVLVMSAFIMGMACIDCDSEEIGKCAKKLWKYAIISIIGLVISLLLPSEETLIRMEIAKNATYENVEVVMEEITNVADHIIEELKED
jgi:NADH:ubiquinone oxidoreductase subunit 6 (subunit J)